jgi:hypothetical protein
VKSVVHSALCELQKSEKGPKVVSTKSDNQAAAGSHRYNAAKFYAFDREAAKAGYARVRGKSYDLWP